MDGPVDIGTRLTTRVGLGTAPLGSYEGGPLWWGPQERDDSVRTVAVGVEAGVGWIDTAPFYGWGRAEEIVADALDGLPQRPLVLTKCGTHRGTDGRPFEDASPDAVRRDVDGSRQRLRVERLDAVQVHDPDPTVPVESTWSALAELVADGLVGGAGLSNHDVDTMERARRIAPVAVVQHQYSLLHRQPEQDGVLDWCAEHGIPFLAWAPLASGFLTDDFDLESLHPTDLRRRLRWATTAAGYTDAVRRKARAVAERHGCTLQAVALAWVTRRSGVLAIVGARTPAESRALTASLPVLDDTDLAALDK